MTEFDYDNYGAYKGSAGVAGESRVRVLLRRIGVRHRYLRFVDDAPRDEPLLEIGCGDGSFMRELICAGFSNVVGVDPSGSYSPVVDPRLIVRGFAQDHLVDVPAGTLGTVIAFDVLEHIPIGDLRRVLSQIERCLRPGGKFLIRVPNMASPLGMLNYFGDLSHTTPMNEMSLRQIAFDGSFDRVTFLAEPFAFPTRLSTLVGILLWIPYRLLTTALLAAFGIRPQVFTPNLVCVMTKAATRAASAP